MRFDRRRLLRFAAATGLALAAGSAVRALPAAAAEAQYRTITALKLRAAASSKGNVKLVMPTGAIVDDLGYAKNGYIKVRYRGTAGWAKAEYLGPVDPDFDPLLSGEAVTTDAANLRQGPSTGDAVILVVPAGSSIQISDSIMDGFRYIAFDGTRGWLFDEYIAA